MSQIHMIGSVLAGLTKFRFWNFKRQVPEEEEGLEKKNEFYFEQIILTEYV